MKLTERSVADLLAAFASSDPTPGGGSAAALASAVGASLLIMVAGLPKTRTGAGEERAALTAAGSALGEVRQHLADAVDADAAAYDRVVAAYRRPKAAADEQTTRKAAIQEALRTATDVPLAVVRLSAAALAHAMTIAANGNRNAASDVGVAVALLRAGLRGARLNIGINAASVDDATYTAAVQEETERLCVDAERAADAAEALLGS